MRTETTGFDSFFAWLQAFDPSLLTNEAEVESKFIVPFFQLLGYPQTCCRLQYSLKMYEPSSRGKRGKGQTIDQIYHWRTCLWSRTASKGRTFPSSSGGKTTYLRKGRRGSSSGE